MSLGTAENNVVNVHERMHKHTDSKKRIFFSDHLLQVPYNLYCRNLLYDDMGLRPTHTYLVGNAK